MGLTAMLYAYQCRRCGADWELRRSVDDRNRAAYCHACSVFSGRRLLTAPVIRGETVARS